MVKRDLFTISKKLIQVREPNQGTYGSPNPSLFSDIAYRGRGSENRRFPD